MGRFGSEFEEQQRWCVDRGSRRRSEHQSMVQESFKRAASCSPVSFVRAAALLKPEPSAFEQLARYPDLVDAFLRVVKEERTRVERKSKNGFRRRLCNDLKGMPVSHLRDLEFLFTSDAIEPGIYGLEFVRWSAPLHWSWSAYGPGAGPRVKLESADNHNLFAAVSAQISVFTPKKSRFAPKFWYLQNFPLEYSARFLPKLCKLCGVGRPVIWPACDRGLVQVRKLHESQEIQSARRVGVVGWKNYTSTNNNNTRAENNDANNGYVNRGATGSGPGDLNSLQTTRNNTSRKHMNDQRSSLRVVNNGTSSANCPLAKNNNRESAETLPLWRIVADRRAGEIAPPNESSVGGRRSSTTAILDKSRTTIDSTQLLPSGGGLLSPTINADSASGGLHSEEPAPVILDGTTTPLATVQRCDKDRMNIPETTPASREDAVNSNEQHLYCDAEKKGVMVFSAKKTIESAEKTSRREDVSPELEQYSCDSVNIDANNNAEKFAIIADESISTGNKFERVPSRQIANNVVDAEKFAIIADESISAGNKCGVEMRQITQDSEEEEDYAAFMGKDQRQVSKKQVSRREHSKTRRPGKTPRGAREEAVFRRLCSPRIKDPNTDDGYAKSLAVARTMLSPHEMLATPKSLQSVASLDSMDKLPSCSSLEVSSSECDLVSQFILVEDVPEPKSTLLHWIRSNVLGTLLVIPESKTEEKTFYSCNEGAFASLNNIEASSSAKKFGNASSNDQVITKYKNASNDNYNNTSKNVNDATSKNNVNDKIYNTSKNKNNTDHAAAKKDDIVMTTLLAAGRNVDLSETATPLAKLPVRKRKPRQNDNAGKQCRTTRYLTMQSSGGLFRTNNVTRHLNANKSTISQQRMVRFAAKSAMTHQQPAEIDETLLQRRISRAEEAKNHLQRRISRAEETLERLKRLRTPEMADKNNNSVDHTEGNKRLRTPEFPEMADKNKNNSVDHTEGNKRLRRTPEFPEMADKNKNNNNSVEHSVVKENYKPNIITNINDAKRQGKLRVDTREDKIAPSELVSPALSHCSSYHVVDAHHCSSEDSWEHVVTNV